MSDNSFTRRSLIQAAGGASLLSLVPRISNAAGEAPVYDAVGEHKTNFTGGRPPVFIALPYLQPGPKSSKLVDGEEEIVIAWQTDGVAADFVVAYGLSDLNETSTPSITTRTSGSGTETDARLNYAAKLGGLKLGHKYRYHVSMKGHPIMEGFFTTRKPRGQKTRFVAFGDNSYGEIGDRNIAFQAYKAMPDFVMNAGDNVYESGLDNEYARYFFPVYNADVAGERIGAPLLRSVPYYTVIANHDVHGKLPNGVPCGDFTKTPDALAYYTNMYLPLNGPISPTPTETLGAAKVIDAFKQAAGERFPKMANYSFDYGDAHFLCLDSNAYIDPTRKELQAWVEQDLASTDAIWKIVVYHHPAFNVGDEHYHEQHMRVLCPIFERHGASLVLSGHEHNFQRTRPLTFEPVDASEASDVGSKSRLVSGKFTVDHDYDGVKNIHPKGIIHITTGAGGKHLYDAAMNDNPKNWTHEEDDNVAYAVTVVSDRHSLTVVDVESHALTLRQVDQFGNEIDRWKIGKSGPFPKRIIRSTNDVDGSLPGLDDGDARLDQEL